MGGTESSMTRWNSQSPEKKPSQLAVSRTINGEDFVSESLENGDHNVISSSTGSYVHCGTGNSSPKSEPESPQITTSIFEKDIQNPETTVGNLDSTNEASENTSSSSGNNGDIYKTAIPLPPGPASVGTGPCGGNQSFLRKQQTTLNLRDNSFSSYAGSSWGASVTGSREREPGDIGLSNLGNTCFMNSGLQCLLHTPPLVEYFLNLENENSPRKGNDCVPALVYQFHSMMKRAWVGTSLVLDLHDFKSELGRMFNQFNNCHQHDCQEFLAITLDALHEQLKNLKGKNQKKQLGQLCVLNENVSNCNSSQSEDFQNKVCAEDRNRRKLLQSSSEPLKDSNKKSVVREQHALGEAKSPVNNNNRIQKPMDKKQDVGRRKRPQGTTERSIDKDCKPHEGKSSALGSAENLHLQIEKNGEGLEADGLPPLKKRKEDYTDLGNKGADNWRNHLASNDTVIASTFQGMYKSTVRCSRCSYVSITYEPFMYLSLPIPHDVDRQLIVTYIGMKDRRPQKVEININVQSTVATLKQEVAKKIILQDQVENVRDKYVVAIVSNYYVHNILADDITVKCMNERGRNIYVIETNTNFDDDYSVTPFPLMANLMGPENSDNVSSTTTNNEMTPSTYLDEDWEQDEVSTTLPPLIETTTSADISSTTENISGEVTMLDDKNERQEDLIMCKICLEELKASEIKQHINCNCFLCKDCLTKSIQHFETTTDNIPKKENFLKCAVCSAVVSAAEFLPVGTLTVPPVIILLLVPVLFRNDPDPNSVSNSQLTSQMFGHPWLIRVPSHISATELYKYLAEINPFPQIPSKFLIAGSDGKSCIRCTKACTGCEIPKVGMISLSQKNISIVMSYTNLSLELSSEIQPNDMSSVTETLSWAPYRPDEPIIDIHDCLKSFSQIEHLDAQNPWYCPECKKDQRATKAMAICHLPDYLIVYLKRFVFLDHSSNKLNNRLKFPLTGLDVRDYMAEEFAGKDYTYDLYSCVCHYGGASSGHYTAFGKNPNSGSWHLFNDSIVSNQGPKEDEYASAYILFYERKGIRHNINDVLEKCRSMPERNISSFSSDRSRAVGIVPPTKINHHSGGNIQENITPSKSSISTLTLGNHGIYNDGAIRNSDGIGNSLDELSLRIACPKASPNDSGNYPHAIPSLKHAMEDECGSGVSNSSDWEIDDKGELPTLKNQSTHQGNVSSDSGMEDNQENNTPEEEEEAGPSSSRSDDVSSSKPTISSNRSLNFSKRSSKTPDSSQN